MLPYPDAYINFLIHFQGSRDYFECHEILEDYWKGKGAKHPIWLGLIQLAVAQYHYRRGNLPGAQRMLHSSIGILSRESLDSVALDKERLLIQLVAQLKSIGNGEGYQSILLPISDEKLIEECKKRCREQGYRWLSHSDMWNEYLLNKHKMRDRSDIKAERERQLKLRKRY
jgi:predicted metal-dependent hydrolase